MKKKSKFIPYDCFETIYDIDYDKLIEENRKVIVFDLDNTIMPYHIKKPTEKIREFMQSLKEKGLNPILMSNNHRKRISTIGKFLGIDYIYDAKKPFKDGYKKVFRKFPDLLCENIICVGDQLITDVLGARRVDLDCILVRPILLSNEHWYTKINRMNERRIVNRMRKSNPVVFTKIIKIRGDIKA